ncbi:MAG: NAD(P)-dependent glycerol-3-phosphate dehydrogenase [Acidobacteria bacterium]|nr:NAD(P)-dependent glycerol-3-phosphate dehydrogenase [Acidobacteriota bacterium]
MKRLAIIGGGSWGTALSIALAPRFESLRLWIYEKDLAHRVRAVRENDVYLPGFQLPPDVEATADLAEALEGAEAVLSVMPSHHVRRLFQQMLPHLEPSMLFVSATKGIENGTLLRMTEVISDVVSARFPPRVCALSGPTFAREIAKGEPAALVVASNQEGAAIEVQQAFAGPMFRLYTNLDPIGVELGAALKNVIAIGAGVCHGLGLGSNTVAALITRGLAEISRLALAMGGQPKTLAGLAGLGDLVLTCTGDLSRNRKLGLELARGRKLDDIVSSMKMVAEGVHTTYAAVDLAKKYHVDMPITAQMDAIFRHGRSPKEAVRELMERSLKGE